LLKDAPLLILDEATSALDTESEGRIRAALEEVRAGRSTLLIAHGLGTVENADEIVVLDEGRIVERGRHADLLASCGLYAALHDRQPGASRAQASTRTAPAGPSSGASRAEPASFEQRILAHWYSGSRVGDVLAPLGAVTGFVARWRRDRATADGDAWRAPVPVIVVGNLTVGGTGKTPFVIWLARWLTARGWRPGIVGRGHGGAPAAWPVAVGPTSAAPEVGDEALLLQRETGCPVHVAPARSLAARALLAAHPEVDVLLADDGLQHHALARDLEIVLLDGARGLGNGRCLPAGPLREPAARLDDVDLLVSNGGLRAPECERRHERFDLVPGRLRRLVDDATVAASALAAAGPVHAVAGIGHPERFFATLESLGVCFTPHPFDDHAPLPPERLAFGDDAPIVCTEKDAVRVEGWLRDPAHASLAARCHALAVELRPTAGLERALVRLLATLDAARTLEVE
jgi:tetraacyldisaccharide 4'-kinase